MQQITHLVFVRQVGWSPRILAAIFWCHLQEFFRVYEVASSRQQLTRACVRKALTSIDHGFSAFDANLIHYASLVNDAYDRWYVSWARAVQVRCCSMDSLLTCSDIFGNSNES